MTQISDPSAPDFSPMGWLGALAAEGDYQRALEEFRENQISPGDMEDFEEDLAWAVRQATPLDGDPTPTRNRLLAEPDVIIARRRSESVQATRDFVDAQVDELLARGDDD
ncbi:hypothetical protein ACG83_10910 [Frankia sp. R43]|uniref:hypothetical protein n=1 Tax=Frankia sp. R43 TaxID=269536 RepID=UPI0006CA423C|nr:hypothetical protein [Frankia sp. R43]KPM55775.1 hypothetical protein ACG83_10910 [Frankia sp. R43]